jgi:hypothetical protein
VGIFQCFPDSSHVGHPFEAFFAGEFPEVKMQAPADFSSRPDGLCCCFANLKRSGTDEN